MFYDAIRRMSPLAQPSDNSAAVYGWTGALAAACVTHTSLPESATLGLQAAFVDAGVEELR